MRIKVNDKRILACLLLFSLFLTSFVSVINTYGIIGSDGNAFDIFSVSGGSEHSSMNGGANVGYDDYIAGTTSTGYSIFSMRQSQWLGTKTGFSILTAILAALATCLFYYLRISTEIYAQSNSTMITVFLHKKDGKK